MSALVLSVLRCPDGGVPETRRVAGGEFAIGRGPENDWVLADPDRVLSKRHCVIAFRGGAWQVTDTSTNGLYLNREPDPLGRDRTQELRDGDRLRLGAWEIEARVEAGADTSVAPFAAGPADHGAHRFAAPPRGGDPFGLDPFADGPAPARTPFDEPVAAPPGGGVQLPDDFDPLAPDPAPEFGGPVQPDHTPAFGDAFRPPPAQGPMAQGGAVLGAGPIPEDFDPFAEDDALRATPPPPVAASRPEVAPPPPPPPERPAPAPVPVVAPAAGSGELLSAFLRGAGLGDAAIADPPARMEALGAAFRALVAGLRRALIARASIKGEFRIEQTIIRARGNNPLKFSAGDDDALMALLGAGRRTDMDAPEAVADALEDIRLHELASMAAMQAAIRALLERLDPAPLLANAKGGLLPGQRKAQAFEDYEALHREVAAALADDFDSVFGKAFARAYEAALADARSRASE